MMSIRIFLQKYTYLIHFMSQVFIEAVLKYPNLPKIVRLSQNQPIFTVPLNLFSFIHHVFSFKDTHGRVCT